MNIKRIFGGDRRTALIKKNIAGSLLIKGWSCIVQFLIVPLSLQCLTKYEYGIWLTINSILMGIDAIDVGLSNGLRNRLAEAMALDNLDMARQQVSTTFFMLVMIMLPLIMLFAVSMQFVDGNALMNVSPELVPDMRGILVASVAIMGSTFIFKFIGNMYMGLQLPAINNLLVVLGQTVSLGVLFVLSLLGHSSLMTVAVAFTASPLLVYLIAYPVSFCGKYNFLAPSLRFFDKESLHSLFGLGVKFFVIQVSGLMLFMSSNVIISHVMNPAEVTPYQIAYRYFSLLYMLFTIIASPLWSATTDAYTKGEWDWIRLVMRKMNYLLLICGFVVAFMVIIAPLFYHLWIGDKVDIGLTLNVMMALYTYMLVVSNSYSYILMGIGKIRMILVVTISEMLVFVPIEYFACKYARTTGLLSSLILSTAICAILNNVQFRLLSSGKATGIWNK